MFHVNLPTRNGGGVGRGSASARIRARASRTRGHEPRRRLGERMFHVKHSMRAGDDGSRAWYTRARRTQGERGKGANRKARARATAARARGRREHGRRRHERRRHGRAGDGSTSAQEGGPIPRARAFRRPALPPRQPQGSAAPRWGATSRRLGRPRSDAEPRRASRSRCSCGGRAQTTGAGGPR